MTRNCRPLLDGSPFDDAIHAAARQRGSKSTQHVPVLCHDFLRSFLYLDSVNKAISNNLFGISANVDFANSSSLHSCGED